MYSMLNRWIEPDLLDTVGELGIGCIAFSPLAQGVLTGQVPRRSAGGLACERETGRFLARGLTGRRASVFAH